MKKKNTLSKLQAAWNGTTKMPVAARPELLLHPQIPKPMHTLSPRVVLGDVWWKEQKSLAKKTTNDHCAACGVHMLQAKFHTWLECHECYEINYSKGRMVFIEVVPLCHACHNFIHKGRMEMLVKAGEMPIGKMQQILSHGRRVLSKVSIKLQRRKPFHKSPKWNEWRMVIGEKEYPSPFKDFIAWCKHFNIESPKASDRFLSISYHEDTFD